MSSHRRLALLAPLVVLVCTWLGGGYGPPLGAASAASKDQVKVGFEKFAQLLAVVEQNYAEDVDLQHAIFQGAIPNMLRALDPHSQFFSPEAFKHLREEQKGQYAGVGMTIGPRQGRTVVIAPFPKTPAYRAGLRPGDAIVEVDGESTEGWNTTKVAKHLRGPAGTKVRIGIERRGVEGLLEFEVTRARIPRKSVPVASFLQPHVGFIRIATFNETTGKELDRALKKLDEPSLEGLILDLRSNRGGLLSEGVRVSDRFVEKGQTIVSHYGRISEKKVYRAKNGNGGLLYPMIVLVNCDSASASEIVAGALQDHDRALIVGENTFGKGLVQTVYPMAQTVYPLMKAAGLALTTARYYTPSGRLIQRRYDNISLFNYYSDPCSEQYQPTNSEVRRTDQGRQVFGGGGITPDVVLEDQKLNDFQIALLRTHTAFATYAQEYTLQHPDLAPGWEATDKILEDFRQFLLREKISFTEVDFIQNTEFIRRFLIREVYVSAYDLEEGEKVYYQKDPDVERALKLLPKAQELLHFSQRMVAERRGPAVRN